MNKPTDMSTINAYLCCIINVYSIRIMYVLLVYFEAPTLTTLINIKQLLDAEENRYQLKT